MPAREFIEQSAEDLGGHDDYGRVGVNPAVSSEEADAVGAEPGREVSVLLIGECLDGRRVYGA